MNGLRRKISSVSMIVSCVCIFFLSPVSALKSCASDDKIVTYNTFASDTTIERVEIGYDIIGILDGSFSKLKNLKYISVDSRNPLYASYDGCLYNKDFTRLLCIPQNTTQVEILTSVESYSEHALDGLDESRKERIKQLIENGFKESNPSLAKTDTISDPKPDKKVDTKPNTKVDSSAKQKESSVTEQKNSTLDLKSISKNNTDYHFNNKPLPDDYYPLNPVYYQLYWSDDNLKNYDYANGEGWGKFKPDWVYEINAPNNERISTIDPNDYDFWSLVQIGCDFSTIGHNYAPYNAVYHLNPEKSIDKLKHSKPDGGIFIDTSGFIYIGETPYLFGVKYEYYRQDYNRQDPTTFPLYDTPDNLKGFDYANGEGFGTFEPDFTTCALDGSYGPSMYELDNTNWDFEMMVKDGLDFSVIGHNYAPYNAVYQKR